MENEKEAEREIKSRMRRLKNKANKRMPSGTYSMRITPPPTTKLEKEFMDVIVKTLSRLPKKIRENVIDKVSFELCRDGMISCIVRTSNPSDSEPTIMFNCVYLANKSDSFKMKVVAHEIGHFALNHLSEFAKINKKLDREVDDLCEKWGVGRLPKRG